MIEEVIEAIEACIEMSDCTNRIAAQAIEQGVAIDPALLECHEQLIDAAKNTLADLKAIPRDGVDPSAN